MFVRTNVGVLADGLQYTPLVHQQVTLLIKATVHVGWNDAAKSREWGMTLRLCAPCTTSRQVVYHTCKFVVLADFLLNSMVHTVTPERSHLAGPKKPAPLLYVTKKI